MHLVMSHVPIGTGDILPVVHTNRVPTRLSPTGFFSN